MSRIIFVLFVFLWTSACNKFQGYKKLTPSIYYSLIQFGDNGNMIRVNDYLTLDIEFTTDTDSVFFHGKRKIKVTEPPTSSSLDNCFLKLSKGDSASFIVPADKFFSETLKKTVPRFLESNSFLKINMRILDIQSEKEFQEEKRLFTIWLSELSEYERIILQKFLKEEEPGIERKREGFYMLQLRNGEGKTIKKGDHIWVHYEGKFLNGKYFDGTYRSKDPVDFIYGDQLILLPGLEKALSYMSEGEKALVILPSSLAFGESGDEFGIIPPYTSLIYILEVIKIESLGK